MLSPTATVQPALWSEDTSHGGNLPVNWHVCGPNGPIDTLNYCHSHQPGHCDSWAFSVRCRLSRSFSVCPVPLFPSSEANHRELDVQLLKSDRNCQIICGILYNFQKPNIVSISQLAVAFMGKLVLKSDGRKLHSVK